jgi:histidinol-phosphate/aromatic aminotransferase/cobyric acid decarboxylase-like protein
MIVLALQNWKYFKERIQQVVKEREWLSQKLVEIDGIAPYASEANFVLFRITKEGFSSSTVTKRLRDRNVLVKDRGDWPLLANCIRVGVGTREMNQTFLAALRKALEEKPTLNDEPRYSKSMYC